MFYTRLSKAFREREAKFRNSRFAKEPLSAAYTDFWNSHQSELGHYYRYLYNIVRFIKEEGQEKGRTSDWFALNSLIKSYCCSSITAFQVMVATLLRSLSSSLCSTTCLRSRFWIETT